MLIRIPRRAPPERLSRVKSSPLRRAPLVSLFAAFLAAPTGGCAAHEDPVIHPDFETRLVLKNPAGDETREFQASETITFVVTIRNRTSVPRTLTFPTSQTHDCFVNTPDHKEVWRHSYGRMFAQVITELTLKPGESRVFTATWNQTDAQGRPVPPGEYEAVGLVNGRAPGCRPEPLRFTVRPAAAGKPTGS